MEEVGAGRETALPMTVLFPPWRQLQVCFLIILQAITKSCQQLVVESVSSWNPVEKIRAQVKLKLADQPQFHISLSCFAQLPATPPLAADVA